MAERVTDNIRKDISKYSDLSNVIHRLDDSGIISRLEELNGQVYELGKTKNFKENFKIITQLMVKEVWQRRDKEGYEKHASAAYLLENSIKSPRNNGLTMNRSSDSFNKAKSRRSQSHQGGDSTLSVSNGSYSSRNGYTFGIPDKKSEIKIQTYRTSANNSTSDLFDKKTYKPTIILTERKSETLGNQLSSGVTSNPTFKFTSK